MNKLALGALLVGASIASAGVQPEAVPGEYVVKLKSSAFSQENSRIQSQFGIQVVRKISEQSGTILVRDSVVRKADKVVAVLSANPAVEYVEPNFIYRISALPNDPDMSKLWGMHNDGQVDPKGRQGIEDMDIDADKAWEITTGSKDVIVAVIDTGVDANIPDLKNNMWVNEGEIPGNNVDDDNNGFVDDVHGYDFGNKDGDPLDDHGHGSHCAGTIGAEGNNGIGVVGVTWNVRIMAIKFLKKNGGGTLADAVSSIDYATQMGAHVQSNSWGGGGFSEALKEAIERSHKAGVLFVAAAGNDRNNNDTRPSYPATYDVPNVISVAAANNSGELASFSNYGRKTVHLAAPGRNIHSTIPSGFAAWSGTSMATPHVSGAAALLLSNEPELSGVELRQRLLATSRPLAGLSGKVETGGMLNVFYALTNTKPPADPNDPSRWESQAKVIESDHPYKNSANRSWKITVPGATKLALRFSRFETENNYDKVSFYDASGVLVGSLTGENSGAFSPVVTGDTMEVRLTSDGSVNKWGIKTDKVFFK